MKIEITRYRIQTDPTVDIFTVAVHEGEGVWCETFGSEDLLNAFIKGVRAGRQPEYVTWPGIPSENDVINVRHALLE